LKRRIPSHYRSERAKFEQNVDKLRRTVTKSITTLQVTWNDGKNVSMRDKIAFVSAVGNIFFTGFLLGAAPEKLPIWYTGQMIYYMPLRYFSYKNKGYHYFIADLCYWVNLLVSNLALSWGIGRANLAVGLVLVGFPEFAFSVDRHVLSCQWTRSLGHHRLAKLARLA
jgi:hypothetical protein